ncbi:undecaprenyl/decaprenyl-phosphate alpha-N-acetylglucosaminyl 1-phosphate transferase [bacterium]|nr:undecaprenyl/decaprenyl-phosphate alpha-N-acetylglucosaminyl 1-phosphate transferase [bacterium]
MSNALSGLVVAFALAGVATWGAALLLPRLFPTALLDRPGPRKPHARPTPRWGGTAILVGIAVVWAWSASLGGGAALGPPFTAAAIGLLLAWAVGLADDWFGLRPWPKLLLQLGAGLAVALAGLGLALTGWPVADAILTALFLALLQNAYNFLDGLDGLLATHTLLVAMALVWMALALPGQALVITGLLAGALVVTLTGFLPVNLVRGKVFPGDSGSHLCGMAVGICLLAGPLASGGRGYLAAALLVALPVGDLLWAVIRRLAKGVHPFTPDSQHLHHLLAARVGAGRAVAQIAALTVATSVAAVAIAGALQRP